MASYVKANETRTDNEITTILNPDRTTFTYVGGPEQAQKDWDAQRGPFDDATPEQIADLAAVLAAIPFPFEVAE